MNCIGAVSLLLRDHTPWLMAGVTFGEAPRSESCGRVVVFEDLCGNARDLIEPARQGRLT